MMGEQHRCTLYGGRRKQLRPGHCLERGDVGRKPRLSRRCDARWNSEELRGSAVEIDGACVVGSRQHQPSGQRAHPSTSPQRCGVGDLSLNLTVECLQEHACQTRSQEGLWK